MTSSGAASLRKVFRGEGTARQSACLSGNIGGPAVGDSRRKAWGVSENN